MNEIITKIFREKTNIYENLYNIFRKNKIKLNLIKNQNQIKYTNSYVFVHEYVLPENVVKLKKLLFSSKHC